jgi:hypothetical protein
MFDVDCFISGIVVGTGVTTLFAWEVVRHYKVLYEISELDSSRIYDRLFDKENEE